MQSKASCPSPADKTANLNIIVALVILAAGLILYPASLWGTLIIPPGASSYILAMYVIGWIVAIYSVISIVHYLLSVGKCKGIVYGM